jgi:hypothetical protein
MRPKLCHIAHPALAGLRGLIASHDLGQHNGLPVSIMVVKVIRC